MCYNKKCNPSFTFSRNETTTEPTEEETSENDDLTDKDYVKESNGTTKIVNNDNYEGEIRAEIASNELERNKNERILTRRETSPKMPRLITTEKLQKLKKRKH